MPVNDRGGKVPVALTSLLGPNAPTNKHTSTQRAVVDAQLFHCARTDEEGGRHEQEHR
jgi:hypothetical protein